MKIANKLLGLVFMFMLAMSVNAATWYVRPDGGTRYSTNVTNGQCNGLGDAAYSGSGVNQNCAFKDVRMLWQDGSYTYGTTFPGWGWVISGGDTVIIRGSIGTGVSYRVGWNSAATYCDSTGCWGITGSNSASGAPPPPSGTVSQPTRILGENYGSCTSQNSRTQLHGGWGTGSVLSLIGSSNVQIACLDLTDFSNCGKDGDTVACETNGSIVQDFADVGIQLNNTTTNITLNDIRIHGLAADGMLGAPGDGFVAADLQILGNADAGWNTDDSSGTTGVGSLLVQNFNISWNGCVEEYPIVDPLPYFSCTDQSSGGYGDGFGTATVASPAPGWQVHFDNGIVSYNTQDGLDALHVGGPGSTMTDTRVLAFGNQGNQLKVGGATATIQNSIINGNCEAMSTQTIPGTPSGFGSKLAAACRAGNTGVLINVTPGDPATFQYNTLYESGAIGLEVEYASGNPDPTDTLLYNDNIFIGFLNAGSNSNPTPIYSNTDLNMLTNPGASWTNNATFGYRTNWTCPAVGESNALCSDPGLADETYHAYGYGNVAPSSSASAVVGEGVALQNVTTDFTGAARPSSDITIGALNLGSVITGYNSPTGVTTGGSGGSGGSGGGQPTGPIPEVANTFFICMESQVCVVTAISDSTAIGQFGTGSTWCQTFVASTLTLPSSVNYGSPSPNTQLCPYDPAPGLVKTLVFQQKATGFTVSYTLNGVAQTPISVPGTAPIAPTITWSTPVAIRQGTALTATQLNATANVAGTFVYTPALGSVPPPGTDILSLTFTPSVVGYSTVTTTVQLVVNPFLPCSGTVSFSISANGTVTFGTSTCQ